jgi:16S rRNA (adenine1518-N6/adenine1519-N6)-dimethyltransferase
MLRKEKCLNRKNHWGRIFCGMEEVLKKIVASADLKVDDFVVEIGPGTGVLTRELVKFSKKVICIEKDEALARELALEFGSDKVKMIADDVLKINLPKVIEGEVESAKYKLVANIPYYITSPIIRLFLETKYPPSEMILLVQREVAERICARPGQMSILSVSVQLYAKPELLFFVGKESFWPVPEVESAVIRIVPFASFKNAPTDEFFRLVRIGFSSKRKTLVNNLSSGLRLSKKVVEEKMKKAGLFSTQRAQELSVEDWKRLFEEFRKTQFEQE